MSAPPQDWRIHPLSRVGAALISVLGTAVLVGLTIGWVAMMPTGEWRQHGVLYFLYPFVAYGATRIVRLFMIAAWTGEEPPLDFLDPDDFGGPDEPTESAAPQDPRAS